MRHAMHAPIKNAAFVSALTGSASKAELVRSQ
jgi:hypothetical protein